MMDEGTSISAFTTSDGEMAFVFHESICVTRDPRTKEIIEVNEKVNKSFYLHTAAEEKAIVLTAGSEECCANLLSSINDIGNPIPNFVSVLRKAIVPAIKASRGNPRVDQKLEVLVALWPQPETDGVSLTHYKYDVSKKDHVSKTLKGKGEWVILGKGVDAFERHFTQWAIPTSSGLPKRVLKDFTLDQFKEAARDAMRSTALCNDNAGGVLTIATLDDTGSWSMDTEAVYDIANELPKHRIHLYGNKCTHLGFIKRENKLSSNADVEGMRVDVASINPGEWK